MKRQEQVYGLVCAGGGAHGAYQAGVLKYIHEKFSNGNQSPFRVFAGTSCGSLNTSFFACHSADAYAGRLWLEELWMSDEEVKRHLRSDKYRKVLLVIEMAAEPPEIRFDTIIHSSGVETIEQARTQID